MTFKDAIAVKNKCLTAAEPVTEGIGERGRLIRILMWNAGGGGYGPCAVGEQLRRALAPLDTDDSWMQAVAVGLTPDKYTVEELRTLVSFSQRMTKRVRKVCPNLARCNFYLIDKMDDGRWLRKQVSWDYGPMVSSTLAGAIRALES